MKINYLHIFFILALFIPSISLGNDCEDKSSIMAEVRQCLLDTGSKQVDDVYRDVLAKARAKNEKLAELLSKSQYSWKEFSQNSCAFEKSLNADNMLPDDAYVNCMADFSQARIRILKEFGRHM